MVENQSAAQENQQQQTVEQQPAQQAYTPFGANVQQRDYTQANTSISAEQASMEIPEPIYGQQPAKRQDPYAMLGGDGGKGGNGGGASSSEPINPAANNIPESDQKVGAEHLTKIFMDMYQQLHDWGNKALQISDKKLNKMQLDGEIDLNITLPFGTGTITAGELISDYNSQTSDFFVISREFKKEVPPVLTRILQKRGAVLTDEQYLGYMLGKDAIVKGISGFQMKSSLNDILSVIKESMANGVQPVAKASTSPVQHKEQPVQEHQAAPVHEQEPATDNERFNFETNEAFQSSVVTMEVPLTGKDRLMVQKQKEQVWQKNSEAAGLQSSDKANNYQAELKKRKRPDGKRGRTPNKEIQQYIQGAANNSIKQDEDQVAENLALRETVPTKSQEPGE